MLRIHIHAYIIKSEVFIGLCVRRNLTTTKYGEKVTKMRPNMVFSTYAANGQVDTVQIILRYYFASVFLIIALFCSLYLCRLIIIDGSPL